jgi:predicted house-cleaning noncanonical NTP pyrophosphatase (MazG superfamily)
MLFQNFLTELNDKIQKEINEFFELDYEERLQLAYSAIDRIVEHINDFLEGDKKELHEYIIKQNNKSLAIKYSHILPLSEVIALYFANGRILTEIMQYFAETLSYMLEDLA